MATIVKQIFKRENILILLLILGALLGVVGVPQKYGFSSEQLLLALLAVLAFDTLVERLGYLDRIEQLSQKTYETVEYSTKKTNDLLESLSRERIFPKDFFVLDDLQKKKSLETADDFALTGITLNYIVNNYLHIIEQRLSVGVNIRIMLLDTTDSNLAQMQQRGWGVADFDLYRSLLTQSLRKLEIVANKPKSRGIIEIGYLPFYPSFAVDLINASQPQATIWVSVFHHKLSSPTPKFVVNSSDDPQWFGFFKDQFELLWESCRIEQLPKHQNKNA
jgi:hypothetical protein